MRGRRGEEVSGVSEAGRGYRMGRIFFEFGKGPEGVGS